MQQKLKTLASFGFIPDCSVTFPLLFDEKRQAKKDEETKGYGDYNWEKLYKSGNLKKLKVAELNKYIFRHNLSRRKMSKSEKLNLLSAHTSPKVYAKGS